ncbi:hypothetical protein IFM62136_09865 [Aspergillus lentulus]|nr:hypothetical protein IFM62136_09865 [Aspergillus lentulus]
MRRKTTRHYGSDTTNLVESGRMAFTGRTDGDSVADEDVFANTASEPAIPSSVWEHHGRRFQDLTGVRINPEHGKDPNVMKWRDGNDSENPHCDAGFSCQPYDHNAELGLFIAGYG